jgi:hypothetical protein
MTRRLVPALALAAALALPAAVRAQGADLPPANIIAVNPLGLLLPFFSVEYEAALSDNGSAALTASYWDQGDDDAEQDDFRHWSLDAKYRLYPNERAPEGMFVGLVAGLSFIRDADGGCGTDCPEEDRSTTAFATGLEVGYTWMFGARRGIALGVGLGAKRLYFLNDRPDGVSRVQPTARLTIGKAF